MHINSGIPNKAFYLVAIGLAATLGRHRPHLYEAFRASGLTTEFQEFADKTSLMAEDLYGADSIEQQAVQDAWRQVDIRVSRMTARRRPGHRRKGNILLGEQSGHEGDALASLSKHIEMLSDQVSALSKEVSSLKGDKTPSEGQGSLEPERVVQSRLGRQTLDRLRAMLERDGRSAMKINLAKHGGQAAWMFLGCPPRVLGHRHSAAIRRGGVCEARRGGKSSSGRTGS